MKHISRDANDSGISGQGRELNLSVVFLQQLGDMMNMMMGIFLCQITFLVLRNSFLNLEPVTKPLKRHSSEPSLLDPHFALESALEVVEQKETIDRGVKGLLDARATALAF